MDHLMVTDIIDATKGTWLSAAIDRTLTGVSTDSRSLPEGAAFFALSGPNFDGHSFVALAAAKGAGCAVVAEGAILPPGIPPEFAIIKVPDTLLALGDLAASYRRRFHMKLVGITGSNGKTSTKEMLGRILERRYQTLTTRGNLNNLIGLPLMIFDLSPHTEAAVLEMGMSFPGEIARLCHIADPDLGLITNVGPAHLESMKNVATVAAAKGELFAGLRPNATALVNIDDQEVMGQAVRTRARQITYGTSPKAQIQADRIEVLPDGRPQFRLGTPSGSAKIRLKVLGRHNVTNALAAAAAGYCLDMPVDDIQTGLESYRPFSRRMEMINMPEGPIVIDDTYNANPVSTSAAIQTLAEMTVPGRRIVVLGDMLELGSEAEAAHQAIGRLVAALKIDYYFFYGSMAEMAGAAAVAAGMDQDRVTGGDDHRHLAAAIKTLVKQGDYILIKGSRGMTMDKVVSGLIS
ncbi:MAG: UDP-N-acetylmuramoyl-tripeptide--D-alanyl-D-alanine ligase [Deltaproteobacteria bacterium]|nr:UDP-N-acetylmuramoyl-tripeptide--D-alanyl-D-alanine ligase [Deltaproteobacteria bacterium]